LSQKHFLKMEKIPSQDDQEEIEYGWGERSKIEIDRKELFGIFCQIYGEGNAEDFTNFPDDQNEEEPTVEEDEE